MVPAADWMYWVKCAETGLHMLTTSPTPHSTSTVLQYKHTHWWTHTCRSFPLPAQRAAVLTAWSLSSDSLGSLPAFADSWLAKVWTVGIHRALSPRIPASSFSLALHQEKCSRKKDSKRVKNKRGKRKRDWSVPFMCTYCFTPLAFISCLLLGCCSGRLFFALGDIRLWRENSPAAAQWDTPLSFFLQQR